MGEVYRLLAAALFCLLSASVRRFTSLGVYFEGSSFAFLGSLLLGVAGAEHGKESGRAKRAVGVSGGR